MTGLRVWPRDPSLPTQAGDADLCPPDNGEVADLIRAHLLLPEAPELIDVDWEYARWKPGVSTTCTYRVSFADNSDELVVVKRYRGDKPAVLADRPVTLAENTTESASLRPRAVLPASALVLWTPSADRELGFRFLLDPKRVNKLIRDAGLVEPGLVRRRKTRFELLRYKPERRAVFRVRLFLRDQARTRHSMAFRVLPPTEATRVVAARRAFEDAGGRALSPPLACAHERHGLLVEPWLELETSAPDVFEHAAAAGAMLARLHALPCGDAGTSGPGASDRAGASLDHLAALFTGHAALAEALAPLSWTNTDERTTWTHGDFHPDQLVTSADGPLLMDLDCLGVGHPSCDLASWIADHLHEQPDSTWDDAAGPLLAAYADHGGSVPDTALLRRKVAAELARRAAGSFRRLERGAPERARITLQRARSLIA